MFLKFNNPLSRFEQVGEGNLFNAASNECFWLNDDASEHARLM